MHQRHTLVANYTQIRSSTLSTVRGYLLPMTSKTRRLRMLPISAGKEDRLLLRSDNTLNFTHWL